MSNHTQPPEGQPDKARKPLWVDGTPDGILINTKAQLLTRQRAARLLGRSEYLRRPNGRVYVPPGRDGKSNPKGVPRLTVERGVGLPGLWRSIVGRIEAVKGKLFPVPIIHVRNDLPKDDRGFRPPIGFNILKAAYDSGWVIFGGKHMIPLNTLKIVQRTFRKAVDAAAYLRGLGAPTVGKGSYKNMTLVFKDITSVDAEGKVIHAGCDGSGDRARPGAEWRSRGWRWERGRGRGGTGPRTRCRGPG